MLKEAKTALRVTSTVYDEDIVLKLKAGARDLEIAGVIVPGEVDVEFDPTTGAATDSSTLTDPLIQQALITYVRMQFGSPEDYDRVKESYELQKTQLMHASGYTSWGGDRGC